jgi:hypothetical protein
MSNQDYSVRSGKDPGAETMPEAEDKNQNARDAAADAFSKAADMSRRAGAEAKHAASTTASTVAQSFKELMDRQLGNGADLAGHLAGSVRLAADDIARESPLVAGVVHSFANKVDGYAEGLQGQTVDQVTKTASDFTRREPVLVFGLAAVAGFLLLRTMKVAGSMSAPPIQPSQRN